MRLVLAVLAIVTSVVMLGWIGLHDPKRVAAQGAADRPTLSSRQRRVLALSAVVPGLLLILSGWWSSAMMWMGATVILLWLWVLRLSRRTTHAAAAVVCVVLAASSMSDAFADFRDCAECPELVVVPAGEFQIGSAESEAGRLASDPKRQNNTLGFRVVRTLQ